MDLTTQARHILIADTQFLVTTSLKIILEETGRYVVAGIVSNKYNLEKALSDDTLTMLILDFAAIDFNSLDDLITIKKDHPQLAILILTNTVSKNELMDLNAMGIKNIINKTADRDELMAALDATEKGKKYYSEDIMEMLFEAGKRKTPSAETEKNLTNSEIEIVRLIAEGYTTKEIAGKKHISFHTVMSHRKNIFRKLGVTSVSELLMYAIKNGLVDTIEYHI